MSIASQLRFRIESKNMKLDSDNKRTSYELEVRKGKE